jgi:hypothetical protein
VSGAERHQQSEDHHEVGRDEANGATIESTPTDSTAVTEQLNEGLKTCRSVVENYRSLMRENSGAYQPSHGPGDDEAFNDNSGK